MIQDQTSSQIEWPRRSSVQDEMEDIYHSDVRLKKSTQNRAKSHYRAKSGSSIGSVGPASPFDAAFSSPYIASSEDALSPADFDASFHQVVPALKQSSLSLSKALPTPTLTPSQESFLAPAFQNYNPQTSDSASNIEAKLAMIHALQEQESGEIGSSTPGVSSPGLPSVSSIGHHSPSTPHTTFGEDCEDNMNMHRSGERQFRFVDNCLDDYLPVTESLDFQTSAPKLDRTMTDVYQDELINPCLYSASSPLPREEPLSVGKESSKSYHARFHERLRGISNDQLSGDVNGSGTSSLCDKPSYQNKIAYSHTTYLYPSQASQRELGSVARLREQQKAEAEALAFRDYHQKTAKGILDTPKTISPKDALLEYHESDDDCNAPLFLSDEMSQNQGTSRNIMGHQRFSSSSIVAGSNPSKFSPSPSASQPKPYSFTFTPPSVPGGVHVPQQYPFISKRRRPLSADSSLGSTAEQTPEFPAHLTSMESSASDAGMENTVSVAKPVGTMADSGTYTCTYHGCTLRFESPMKLQQHKRDGHRQGTPGSLSVHDGDSSLGNATPGASSPSSIGSANLMRNSQAGPHKCDRINPSTGKPCHTVFSRPYDLTRHEDTIHNARKQKVRCQFCVEDKSFSRNDALTRHMRVVHPEIDFGNKSRRKHHV
ncbi:MAG: hypothetical protein M1825_001565 [Sarcosagium campestre]|nr:MAG: hypothetical protein M1825_001565 [Sarcosagium campestre]